MKRPALEVSIAEEMGENEDEELASLNKCQADLEVELMQMKNYLSVESRRAGVASDSHSVEENFSATETTPAEHDISDGGEAGTGMEEAQKEVPEEPGETELEKRLLTPEDGGLGMLLKRVQESTTCTIDSLHRCKAIIDKLHEDCTDVALTNACTLDSLRSIDSTMEKLTCLALTSPGEKMVPDGSKITPSRALNKKRIECGTSGNDPHWRAGEKLQVDVGKSNARESANSQIKNQAYLPLNVEELTRPPLSLTAPLSKPSETLTNRKPASPTERDELPTGHRFHLDLPSTDPNDSASEFPEPVGVFLTSVNHSSVNHSSVNHPPPRIVMPTAKRTRDAIATTCRSIRDRIRMLEDFLRMEVDERKACEKIVDNIKKHLQRYPMDFSKLTNSNPHAKYKTSRKSRSIGTLVDIDTVGQTGFGRLRSQLQSLASELQGRASHETQFLTLYAKEKPHRGAIVHNALPNQRVSRFSRSPVLMTAQRLAKIIEAERDSCGRIVEEIQQAVRTRRRMLEKEEQATVERSRRPKLRGNPGGKRAPANASSQVLPRLEELREEVKLYLRMEFDRNERLRREMTRRTQLHERKLRILQAERKRSEKNASTEPGIRRPQLQTIGNSAIPPPGIHEPPEPKHSDRLPDLHRRRHNRGIVAMETEGDWTESVSDFYRSRLHGCGFQGILEGQESQRPERQESRRPPGAEEVREKGKVARKTANILTRPSMLRSDQKLRSRDVRMKSDIGTDHKFLPVISLELY